MRPAEYPLAAPLSGLWQLSPHQTDHNTARRRRLRARIRKRQRLYAAGVHLLELDLLRRGSRPIAHPRLPSSHYLVTLTRAGAGQTEIWPLTMREALPIVPVPLRAPDNDLALDLSAAFTATYDEATYDLSIDYTPEPPPPELSATEHQWLHDRLAEQRS